MGEGPVSGVILAAGPSTRFGSSPPKQLFDFEGEPLVRRAARRAMASELSEVIVVVGFAAERVRAAVRDLRLSVVACDNYREGQSASVRAGLAAVSPEACAAMFIPVDQPLLTSAVIDRLLAAYTESDRAIVVPVFRGRRAAPVLIARELFGELARISGDAGGRQLFPAHEEKILEVEVDDERPLRDADSKSGIFRIVRGE